jgi:hypothetical protein
MRTEVFRNNLRQVIRRTPFRPFVISLQNGGDVLVEHPENVAFDPRPNAATDFYVISGDLRLDRGDFELIAVPERQAGEEEKRGRVRTEPSRLVTARNRPNGIRRS